MFLALLKRMQMRSVHQRRPIKGAKMNPWSVERCSERVNEGLRFPL